MNRVDYYDDYPDMDRVLDDLYKSERRIENKIRRKNKLFLRKYGRSFTFSKSVLREFLREHEYYEAIGIVEVVPSDKGMYKNSPHYKYFEIKGVERGHVYEYTKTTTDTYGNDIEYLVWQTCGYTGDEYSGFLLFPMKNGRYYKISYQC